MMELVWIGKKVFLNTCDGKIFQGKVVFENELSITIIDKFSHAVEISRDNIKLMKEEF